MDPLPEIPKTEALNNTDLVIRDTFKERFENEGFPLNIAENLKSHSVDDNLSLKETAKNVLAIYKSLEEESELIKNAELDIIQQHGEYIYRKSVIEKNQLLREVMKIKPCDIFPNISLADKSKYGLIEKCDLYPDMFRQFLDFRFNPTLHKCEECLLRQNKEHKPVPPTTIKKQIKKNSECLPINAKSSFNVEPLEIKFENFELDCSYEKTIKITNISSHTQILTIKTYPKVSELILEYDSCQIMAPGMHAKGVIKFRPKVLLNLYDKVVLISRKGEVITIPIKCSRDPPRLVCYVYKSNGESFTEPKRIPGSNGFSFKRQRAVNNTVDCGSCFATEHVLVSLIVTNVGNRGKFFWLTEDDFLNRDVNHLSTNLELCMDSFWIYPSYFEIRPNETNEINILFQPIKCGLQTQTLFLMCDNNTYQQIELVGDAICFNKHMITIEIPNQTKKLETKPGHCIFMGYVNCKEQSHLTLSISNLSSIYLKFEVKFDSKDEEHSMCNWIQIINMPLKGLAPCTTTDLIFQVEIPDDAFEGYYNTNLKFFVKDVPIASLEEDECFTVKTNGRKLIDITTELSSLNVLILDVEVACYVNPPLPPKPLPIESVKICERCTKENCSCTKCPENSVIDFNSPILDFGLLPVGIDVEKEFLINNLSSEDLNWYIIELKYTIDHPPHLEVERGNNLSTNCGFLAPNQQQPIKYRIVNKTPNRNVSVLVVFSAPKTKTNLKEPNIDLLAQSICLVTYEVIELDIVIQTGQSKEPILCPMQMLYSEVPVTVSFKIHNYSLISGCFWLLPPRGTDADKINVQYKPQSGELKPCESKTVQLELTCYEVGILDEIFIPCFIGEYQEPLQMRLLCVVDCLHVFFYLPTKNNDFQKVLWPPKVIYEYDSNWSHYCSCEEGELEELLQRKKSDHESELNRLSEHTLNNIKSEHQEQDDSNCGSVLRTMLDQDSDIFLQECVMEVRGIAAREPRKVTIYLENVTPKSAKYSIESTNFQAKENHIRACLGPVYKKSDELWGSMITEYGIMIQPERETGYIKPNELVSLDIWVYANTWGIYVEEIVIDLENIVPFSFSMIVEIVGCPLEIPHAIGCITEYPIIRFGTTTFGSSPVERSFHMKNVSSIEVTVSWHVFFLDENYSQSSGFNFICDVAEKASEVFELNFTDQFYGNEKFDYIELLQQKIKIQPNQQTTVPVAFKPSNVKSEKKSMDLRGYIVGQIMVKDSDRLKSNYFHRSSNSFTLEVAASLVKPELIVEVETPNLQIYANEVALKRQTDYFIKCCIRNPTKSVIEAKIELLQPLSIAESASKIELKPGQCTQINIACNLSYDNILKWGALVYKLPDSLFSMMKCTEKYSVSEDLRIDYHSKTITIYRKLYLLYNGEGKSINPLTVQIFYPNISVKPSNLKFGYVYVGHTKKATISIYNLTGFTVMFDVYKTVSNQEIFVTPAHGEIEKSVGLNRSFTTLAIYFTPTECKAYQEGIRIVTNIPTYYVDIPLKGAGSLNEKFT